MPILLYNDLSFSLSSVILPTLAFIVSIAALCSNRRNAKNNIRLSILQAIFRTVSEKAKDCNTLWEIEPDINYKDATHYKVMSELIITTEIIEKSMELFSKNDKSIILIKKEFYWLFWKQLRTDLRGWIKRTPEIVKQMEPKNDIYSQQVSDLNSKFETYCN